MNEDIPQLTTGFCDQAASSTSPQDPVWATSPIVQILQAKIIENIDRLLWRTLISDGAHISQAIVVSPQLRTFFENGDAVKGSVVRLQRIVMSTINGRRQVLVPQIGVARCSVFEQPFGTSRVINIIGLEILVKEAGKIGNPTPRTLNPPGATASAPPSVEGPSGAEPDRPTLPIEALNPYSNNWTIKARVTRKSEIRTWSNNRGEGKLFSITLTDETGEICATGFNSVIDQLYNKFEEGKVYYISKAKVKVAKKQFNNVANDSEIALDKTTEVEEARTRQN